MTNGIAPSAVAGDTLPEPSLGGVPLRFVFPQLYSSASYTDLPAWWSVGRDVILASSLGKEAMWASAVGMACTRVAAMGWTVKDSQDSARRVTQAQELFLGADGEEGWIPFITKVVQDYLTTDNGCFIRVRAQGERAQIVRTKAADDKPFTDVLIRTAAPAARVSGLYHLDSLRCTRTGNLAYPVRYLAVDGTYELLRWDQVLYTADLSSPRAEMFGVGRCAASRAYPKIAKLAALEQMIFEGLTGGGANKLAFLKGVSEPTLKGVLEASKQEQAARGLLYYMGTILAAIPSDIPLELIEVRLKELVAGLVPKEERDDAYLIYADAIGIPVQDLQPLSGQGLGTGTQSTVLNEAARGYGLAAFLKWFTQTVSRRVLPKTTEFGFENEHDTRDQKAKAEVKSIRAQERATRIASGEISPAMARQLALDDGDLPPELLPADATAGGGLADDEKPLGTTQESPIARMLANSAPTIAPSAAPQQALKARTSVDRLLTDAAVLDQAAALLREVAGG